MWSHTKLFIHAYVMLLRSYIGQETRATSDSVISRLKMTASSTPSLTAGSLHRQTKGIHYILSPKLWGTKLYKKLMKSVSSHFVSVNGATNCFQVLKNIDTHNSRLALLSKHCCGIVNDVLSTRITSTIFFNVLYVLLYLR